jgi:hypothetical protein
MANEFPAWTSTRVDNQSLGFQVINTVGNLIERLDQQLVHIGNNYFLSTVNLNEIDLIYRYDLGGDFEFASDTTDPAQVIYTPPTTTGTSSGSWYGTAGTVLSNSRNVTIANNNDIENFWYKAVPTRVRIKSTTTASHTVLAATTVGSSPILSGLGLPHLPGKLYIKISGGTRFIRQTNNELVRCLVTIEGTSRKGLDEEETLVFLKDDVLPTSKEWTSLKSVKVYGLEPSSATIAIYSARFNLPPYPDFYNLFHGSSGNKIDTWWNARPSLSGSSVIEVVRESLEDPRAVVLGFSVRNPVRSIVAGSMADPVQDLAVQPFSSFLWLCGGQYVAMYNQALSYPNFKGLTKKVYDSEVRIEASSTYQDLDETNDLYFRLVRATKDIAKSRITYSLPDGTSYGIVNGVQVAPSGNLWVDGMLDQTNIQQPFSLPAPAQQGAYIITLEVVFTDGTSTCDQRVVTVDSTPALTYFNVSAIIPSGATGIDFDSDGQLWVLGGNGTKYQLEFAYDNMLVDYDQKVIYLRDEFTALNVVA